MKTCLIFSGGTYTPLSDAIPNADYVIACDRGWQYALRDGVKPDVIIGDFDSAPAPDISVPILVHPVIKDDTDTMLAVRHGLEQGCDHFCFLYALGGRADHMFANLQTAAFAVNARASAVILGQDDVYTFFSGRSVTFPRRPGWSLSVFAISDVCTGVSISGTKYEVEGAELNNYFPLGVSNAWASESAEICVDQGILMVVESRLQPGEHN